MTTPRVLVTGATGFAGRHLVERCRAEGAEVVGIGSSDGDLTDPRDADRAVQEANPDRVFHLAAQASVAASWDAPLATLEANVAAAHNVLDAVRRRAPRARVLVTGSSEAYGPVPPERQPIVEDEPPRPQNPYAVSKAAAELLAGFFADVHGLDVVRTRAFNHAGPGQHERYVVSSFARQVAEAEAAGRDAVVIDTGNLETRRDFTDVRDVVRAYWLALDRAPAGVYNVASGNAVAVRDIFSGVARHARIRVEQRTDPERVRATEVMEFSGSHERLTTATGWRPEISLDQTIADALDDWRARLREEALR